MANLQVIRDAIEFDLILEHGLVFNCNSDDSIALSGRIFCCEVNNELRFSCACSYLDIAHCRVDKRIVLILIWSKDINS